MSSFVVTEHIHVFRMLRRERVPGRQRRLRRQTQVHEHGGEHDMRRLSRWVDQRWSEGLHRCFVCARLRVLGVGMRHLVTAHIHLISFCRAVDVDECLENNGGCDSKRKCTNTKGGHECGKCPVGWSNDGATGCKGLCAWINTSLWSDVCLGARKRVLT